VVLLLVWLLTGGVVCAAAALSLAAGVEVEVAA